MSDFTYSSQGGGLIGASAIVLVTNRTGIKCLFNKSLSTAFSEFVLPRDAGQMQSGLRNGLRRGALVPAITICRQNLTQTIRTVQNSTVYSRILPKALQGGGVDINGYATIQEIIDIISSGGTFGDGSYQNIDDLYEFGLGGTLADGTANVYMPTPEFTPIFDGSFYLENNSPSGLPLSNSVRSMFGWVKPVSYTTGVEVMFGYGPSSESTHDHNFLLYNRESAHDVCFWGSDIDTDFSDFSDMNLIVDDWNFIGMTWNGSTIILYINGNNMTQTGFGSLATTSGPFRVALGENWTSTFSNLFIGDIKDIGVWNRVLDSDQVNELHNSGPLNFDDLPEDLTETTNLVTVNSQARFVNLEDLQARSVIIQDLEAAFVEPANYQAASFDGASQISISNAPTNVVSISVWVNINSGSSFGPLIVKGDNNWNSTLWDWGLFIDADNFYAIVQGSYSFCTIGHSNNTWYHIVLVRDDGSGGAGIYVNGSLAASTEASDANAFANDIYIGGVGGTFMIGDVQEIELFSTALSPSDITNLYNSGNGVYGSHVGNTDLIGGYHLNGDTTDYSVSANDGTWGGTTTYTIGVIPNSGYQAANFDGSSYLTISSAPTNVNSVSLWINSTGGSYGAIITKGNSAWDSGQWDWGIWHDGSNNFYVVATAGGMFASYNYTFGDWYHLVLVRDNGSGSCKFYINGSLIGSGSASSSNVYADTISIGGNAYNLNGAIEEVQLFDIALTSDDVTNLYNSGNGVYGSPTDSGLIGGYHLNGDATDYSSGENNGVWHGTESYVTGIITTTRSVVKTIHTSAGFTLDALTQTNLGDIHTSNGSILYITKPYYANIVTSTGAYLQFGKTTYTSGGLVSYWNLSEDSGTRYDSVGGNHLNEIDLVASFTYTTPVGRGNPVTFTDTSPLAENWLWDFGDDTTSTSQNPTHTYNASDGTFTVTLQINSGAESVSHNIVVEEPSPSFTDSSPVYLGATMIFTDTSTFAVAWLWDFGDGSGTSTSQNPSHTYSEAGTYTVSLQINGDISNTSATVTVNVPSASFTDSSPVNYGSPIDFTDTSGGATSWSWDFGDGIGTSTSQNPSYTYNDAGTYTVTLTINDDVSSTNSSVTVNVVTSYIWQKIDLSSYYNVIGLIPEGDAGEEGSGLDGSGPGTGSNGFDETVLFEHYSSPVTVDGINFDLPSGNSNNAIYCDGQTITLPGGSYDYIYMLGCGVNGGTGNETPAEFIITYSDATDEADFNFFSDWFAPNDDYSYQTVALGGDNNLVRSDNQGPVFIFKYALNILRSKNAVSLTLPTNDKIIILSMSVAAVVPQMRLWVAADQLIGLSNNDLLANWTDLSGSGNNLIQSGGASKPAYKTNIINGLPAIRFDASVLSGDNYTDGKYMTSNATALGHYSVMAVVRQKSPTGKFKIALSWGASSGYTYWMGYIPDDSGQPYPGHFVPGSDSHNDIWAAPVDDTNWHIGEGIFNGTHLSGWSTSIAATGAGAGASGNHNGSSSPLSGTNVVIGSYINNTLFWDGDIAEIMLFPYALNDSDRHVIEQYLIYKYDLESQNEIQQFSFSPTPTAGTFTITVNGQNVVGINYNADALYIQGAINDVFDTSVVSVS